MCGSVWFQGEDGDERGPPNCNSSIDNGTVSRRIDKLYGSVWFQGEDRDERAPPNLTNITWVDSARAPFGSYGFKRGLTDEDRSGQQPGFAKRLQCLNLQ